MAAQRLDKVSTIQSMVLREVVLQLAVTWTDFEGTKSGTMGDGRKPWVLPANIGRITGLRNPFRPRLGCKGSCRVWTPN
jgi:hypothetical protein